ncbi:hypothetical protein [Bradyrhizobium sp.]|uniref:hypothetical protein n=1 Tax=Bradyrhizobium sp. TaxID=376 RepID=UPI0025B8D6BA|nr:hypothetical protein [Bradyrhizobium sp.]
MRVDQPLHSKQGRRSEPTFWVDEPTDDALALLEDALQGDGPAPRANNEPADEARALIEENARLRELVAQLSDLVRKNGAHRD